MAMEKQKKKKKKRAGSRRLFREIKIRKYALL